MLAYYCHLSAPIVDGLTVDDFLRYVEGVEMFVEARTPKD